MWEKTTITIFDRDDGWRVKFGSFISMYDENEHTGVTVWHEGNLVMHSSHTKYKATEEDATKIIEDTKTILGQLGDE